MERIFVGFIDRPVEQDEPTKAVTDSPDWMAAAHGQGTWLKLRRAAGGRAARWPGAVAGMSAAVSRARSSRVGPSRATTLLAWQGIAELDGRMMGDRASCNRTRGIAVAASQGLELHLRRDRF